MVCIQVLPDTLGYRLLPCYLLSCGLVGLLFLLKRSQQTLGVLWIWGSFWSGEFADRCWFCVGSRLWLKCSQQVLCVLFVGGLPFRKDGPGSFWRGLPHVSEQIHVPRLCCQCRGGDDQSNSRFPVSHQWLESLEESRIRLVDGGPYCLEVPPLGDSIGSSLLHDINGNPIALGSPLGDTSDCPNLGLLREVSHNICIEICTLWSCQQVLYHRGRRIVILPSSRPMHPANVESPRNLVCTVSNPGHCLACDLKLLPWSQFCILWEHFVVGGTLARFHFCCNSLDVLCKCLIDIFS